MTNFTYSVITDESVSRCANTAMAATFQALYRDGFITEEQYDDCAGYGIVVMRKGWFTEKLERLLGIKQGFETYACIRLALPEKENK